MDIANEDDWLSLVSKQISAIVKIQQQINNIRLFYLNEDDFWMETYHVGFSVFSKIKKAYLLFIWITHKQLVSRDATIQ